jgi:tetratricopeptide (TPR) repeat protein
MFDLHRTTADAGVAARKAIEWKACLFACARCRRLWHWPLKKQHHHEDQPMYPRSLLLALIAIPFLSSPALTADAWKDQMVIMKRNGIKMTRTNGEGKEVVVGEVKDPVVTVLEEKEGQIKVRSRGIEGWCDKKEAVLLKDAVDYATARIQADHEDADNYYMRGVAWEERGQLDRATKDYSAAIRLDPKSAQYHCQRGIAWGKGEEYDKAIEDFNDTILLDPKESEAFSNRGLVWIHKKQYGKAIKDFDEAIRLEPKDAAFYSNRGNAWTYKKEYGKAIRDYDQAIRLDPEFARWFYNRGLAWASNDDLDNCTFAGF